MKSARIILILLVIFSSVLVTAQSDDTFTFESGVSFEIPAGAELEMGNLPSLFFGDRMVVEVVEPVFIGSTQNATMSEVLEYLVGLVGHAQPMVTQNQFSETLVDGRAVLGYVFPNEDFIQTMVVVEMSDGTIGALNIRSFDPLNDADQDMMRALAATFNSAGAPTAVPTTDPLEDHPITQTYTYDSGVIFGYTDEYVLGDEDDPPVTLEIEGEIFISMVDPNLVGIPAGESMESIIDFAIESTPLTADDFEQFELAGREFAFGDAPDGQFTRTMVLVRFSDDTVGIMDVMSLSPLEDDRLAEVLMIGASFDSPSDEFSGVTREQFDTARTLFDEAMELYDADDFAGAIPLLDEALANDPTFALALYWRGAANHNSGNLEAALADFEAALEREPRQRQILVDIADMQALLDRMDEAAASMQAFIDDPAGSEPSADEIELVEIYTSVAAGEYNGDFYFRRSTTLRSMGRYEDALRDVQIALRNEPTNSTLYALQGSILVDMDRDREAIGILTKGLTIEETSILFFNRAFAYQNLALADFDAMIDSAHDFQCTLLLADETVTDEQLQQAESALNRMMIQSDEYEPITDVADCAA